MDNPKISIIVPVYNVENHLCRCLDSILEQTYDNLEIILVDDGSPDNCGAICDEYAKRNGRIVVIHKENGGVSSARNAGLEIASGEWIGFMDADDWAEHDMYGYLVELTQKYDAGIVQCGVFLDEQESSRVLFCEGGEKYLDNSAEGMSYCDIERVGNSSCNKLFRSKHIENLCFDPDCPMGEDLLFNLQALQRVRGVVLGTQPKYHYVQREDSACHKPPNYEFIHSHRQVLRRAADLFEKNSTIRDFFVAERLRMDMHNCSRMVRSPEEEIADLKAEIQKDLREESLSILKSSGVTIKEKGKLMLIAWTWRVYSFLLLGSKKKRN